MTMYALVDLLIVKPENLKDVSTSEQFVSSSLYRLICNSLSLVIIY